MDKKEISKNIEERKIKEEKIFNQILLDYLHLIPSHKNSEIKIKSIEPTLKGLYIIWSECGKLQRYGKIIK